MIGQGGEDEFVDAANVIIASLQQLNNNVSAQTTQIAGGCCAAITTALTALATSVVEAIGKIPQSSDAPIIKIDLEAIAESVEAVAAAIELANTQEAGCCSKIDEDLKAIANALPGKIDIKPIVDALNKRNALIDIPQQMLDKLQADGAIPAGYAQFLAGGPHDIADILAKFNDWLGSKLGLGEHVSSGVIDLKPAERKIWNAAVIALSAVFRDVADYLGAPSDSFQAFIGFLFDKFVKADEKVIEPTVTTLVNKVVGLLTPTGGAAPSLGNIHVQADKPVSVALGGALAAGVAAYLASWAREGTGETLSKVVELVGAAVGVEQLVDVLVGPYVQHGIKAVADMKARSLFRQHLPKGEDVADWMARGLVTPAFGQTLLSLDGFGDEIQPPTIAAAQVGIRPFQLVRLFQTGLFSAADITDELTFGGMRPASRDRMVHAAPYIATETERKALQATLEAAYVAGLLTDADLQTQVDSIEHNTNRDSLILTAAKWKKLIQITKDLEIEYSTLYKGGLIDDGAFRNFLSGIGLQPDVMNAVAAKAEASANATLLRKELVAAARLENETKTEARRAAMRNYRSGQIPLAALTAALLATGLTPIQAAAWSDLAQAQQLGATRWQYGLEVSATDAALLKERVTALVSQREKQLITESALTAALKNLKIPDTVANAIRAHAEALAKSSKTSPPLLVPVQTSP